MTHRSPETVESPDDERISTSQTFLATRKPWSIRYGTGEFVAENVLAFDTVIHKRINLAREFLVARAHSGIANQTLLQEFRRCHFGGLSAGRRCVTAKRETERHKLVRLPVPQSLRIWKSCPNVPRIQIMLRAVLLWLRLNANTVV